MRFEYRPTHIKEWVRKEITQKIDTNDLDSEIIQNRLERLRGAIGIIKDRPENEFIKWVNDLNTRDSVLLPFVYNMVQKRFQKEQLIVKMASTAQLKRQMFYNLIEQCYRGGNFQPFWSIVKLSFQHNRTSIGRNWSEEKEEVWSKFVLIENSHVKHICEVINKGERPFTNILQDYFILESHKIYEDIIIEMFSSGSKTLFYNETDLFTKYLHKSDSLTAQLLVSGFIKSGSVYGLEDISVRILEKMGTYKKQPMLWTNVEKVLKIEFHQWYLRKNIREFFSGINKEHERFVYWEKFVPKMQDALVIEKENTILFYFDDVVIMEVLGTGAVYVYTSNTFERKFGALVDQYRDALESRTFKTFGVVNFNLKRTMLMDKNEVVKGGWLTHIGSWQYSFDNFLHKRLNWEVDRNAILQESKNDITI